MCGGGSCATFVAVDERQEKSNVDFLHSQSGHWTHILYLKKECGTGRVNGKYCTCGSKTQSWVTLPKTKMLWTRSGFVLGCRFLAHSAGTFLRWRTNVPHVAFCTTSIFIQPALTHNDGKVFLTFWWWANARRYHFANQTHGPQKLPFNGTKVSSEIASKEIIPTRDHYWAGWLFRPIKRRRDNF